MSCLRRRSPTSSSDSDAPLPLPLSGDRGPCKRNVDRFSGDFMFQLSLAEWTALRSQVVISNNRHAPVGAERPRGGARYLPWAFTAATVDLKGRSEVLPVSLSYVHLFRPT